MDFLKWYKNKVESNDQEPPEIIWENIQDDRDIDQSWQVINKHLSKKATAKRNYILVVAAGILILISLGIYRYVAPDFKANDLKLVTESVNNAEKEINDLENISNNKFIVEEKEPKEPKESRTLKDENKQALLAVNEIEKESIIEGKNENTNEIKSTNKLILAKLDHKKVFIDFDHKSGIITGEQGTADIETNNDNERTAFRKLYIGSTGQLANTWLLNEKTYNGLESSSLTSSNASFGLNFGVYIGTNLSKSVDLQLDINIFAQNNQDYNEYLNGHYIEDKLKFNYSQAALSLRYYIISNRFMQGEHGINLGGYLGYLHSAYQTLDGEVINQSANYNNTDYGIFLSYEYIIPVSRNLGFGTGVRAYYGLQNIYSGNEYIPAYLNKTNNASLNITFSLKYNIK